MTVKINENNVALLVDSYKYSHWLQLPERISGMSEYLEARGGPFAYSRFFGLQAIIKRHLLRRFTESDAEVARSIIEPFNMAGWLRIAREHGGRLPVEIHAVPEGTDVPVSNALMRVVNLDPELAWLPTFLETLLQQVWGPTTVCTLSAHVRDIIKHDLEKTCDDPSSNISFKLHDFGLRGLSNMTSGGQLGLAHLVNFMGSDTVPALIEAMNYYNADGVVGFSIPAGEHSEILAWGADGEAEYFRNLFERFLQKGKVVAAPIDTYDMAYCLETLICDEFRERIMTSGGTYVARPDSGDPVEVVPWTLKTLAKAFGTATNDKGFKVLHPSVRVIFGDGMSLDRIRATNQAVITAGFSVENVTYGMGAGLLQKIDRDVQRFAIKASAVQHEDGTWVSIRKTVSSDPSKASKAGRLALVHNHGWNDVSRHNNGWETVPFERLNGREDQLRCVYRNGELLVDDTFDAVRARALKNHVGETTSA
jgi:nicotinamide phosphoribosyltransferase